MSVSEHSIKQGRPLTEELAIAIDPVASARAAGLRYVTDAIQGIRRERTGEEFRYVHPKEGPITDAAVLSRIRSLGIPPAWTEVWICPMPHGHLQATGRDAKGRKQYRYHPRWRSEERRVGKECRTG